MLTWDEVAARIQRAQAAMVSGQYRLTQGPGPKTFHVWNGDPEQQEPYVIRFDESATGTCTCPDYANREGPACKHIALVVLDQWPSAFERWQQKVKALCEAAQEPAPPQGGPDLEVVIRRAVENQVQHHLAHVVATLRQLASTLEEGLTAMQENVVSDLVAEMRDLQTR